MNKKTECSHKFIFDTKDDEVYREYIGLGDHKKTVKSFVVIHCENCGLIKREQTSESVYEP